MEHLAINLNIATSILISIILLLAGSAKFYDLSYTEETIKGLAFLPKKTIPLIKFLLPTLEIATALALLFPFSLGYAAFVSAALFATFTIVLSIAFFQGKDTSCGCFGAASQEKITGITIGRAVAFFVASTLLYVNSLYSPQITLWTTGGSFMFALLGSSLTIGAPFVSWKRNAPEGKPTITYHQVMSRRAALKIIAITVASIILQPTKKASALVCCRCEYQRHYDPPTNCCTSNPPNYTHRHHYWRRCYNICTGQRGRWQKIQPDSCQCECGTCSDSTWVQNECCYVSDCCCSMGTCECGCPC